ncbi:MAG: DUF494 family protein [Krumholzibacteria bacterium]|nr:DUF494 family protein [Candidatus Krumholzibacteria bacterium]
MDLDRNRLKQLLIFLMEALASSSGGQASVKSRVQERAEKAGLEEEDMHDLLDWIEGQWNWAERPAWSRQQLPEQPSGSAFRLWGEAEQEYLTRDALAWLIGLQDRAQIDKAQLEALLQYASFIAMRPLEVQDLEMVIEQVLFRPQRPGMTGGVSDGQSWVH